MGGLNNPSCISLLSDHPLPLQPLAGHVYKATAVERSQHSSNPENYCIEARGLAYLHPFSITAILKRKYNGNEMDIDRFISFRFKFFRFRFVSVFSYFFVSVSVFVNGIKIFPLTDISVFVSVNVNHTGT